MGCSAVCVRRTLNSQRPAFSYHVHTGTVRVYELDTYYLNSWSHSKTGHSPCEACGVLDRPLGSPANPSHPPCLPALVGPGKAPRSGPGQEALGLHQSRAAPAVCKHGETEIIHVTAPQRPAFWVHRTHPTVTVRCEVGQCNPNCIWGGRSSPWFQIQKKTKPNSSRKYLSGLVAKSCLTLATPWTVTHQAPLSIGFSKQKYRSGLPFPSPKHLGV